MANDTSKEGTSHASIPARTNPASLGSGLVGLVLGAGAMVVAMHQLGYRPESASTRALAKEAVPAAEAAPGSRAGGPMMGMMGAIGDGGPMMGGAGGGGGREKRSLAALVGKMELLSKGLHFELDADQAAKIAAKLAELEDTERMSSDEANTHLEALEAILTNEQKATLEAIDLPRAGRAGGGPAGGGGGTGSGTGMGGGRGGGGGSDDENPFQQDPNQQRLRSLKERLRGSSQ